MDNLDNNNQNVDSNNSSVENVNKPVEPQPSSVEANTNLNETEIKNPEPKPSFDEPKKEETKKKPNWLLGLTCVLGAVAITMTSLFIWKATSQGGDTPSPAPSPEPQPIQERETVNFVTYTSQQIPTQKILKGGKASRPTNPEIRDGYFQDWYIDQGYTTAYNFDNPVEKDLTLYAKYSMHLLDITYNRKEAYDAGVLPQIEIELDASENEKALIKWGDSDKLETVTNFNQHITHNYLYEEGDSSECLISIYGNLNSISLSSVDEEFKYITHLFNDSNKYVTGIELYRDMGDKSKSSSMGGLDKNGETVSLLNSCILHKGVTYVPNHFLCSSSFGNDKPSDDLLMDRYYFPDTVTKIGDYAYANNSNIIRAPLRDNIVNIGEGAFQQCSKLVYIRFGTKLDSVSNYAFDGAENVSMLIESFGDRFHKFNTVPTFGIHTNFSAKEYYIDYKTTSAELAKALKTNNWPINGGTPLLISLPTYDLNEYLTCEHTYRMTNRRYPLINLTIPEFLSDSLYGFVAEIICTDDPEVSTGPQSLGITILEQTKLVPVRVDNTIRIKSEELQHYAFPSGFTVQYIENKIS